MTPVLPRDYSFAPAQRDCFLAALSLTDPRVDELLLRVERALLAEAEGSQTVTLPYKDADALHIIAWRLWRARNKLHSSLQQINVQLTPSEIE